MTGFLIGQKLNGDTAEVSLKFLKSPISDDLRKVGSVNHGSYSYSESGPLRLVEPVSKLVQKQGCEKSSKMITFNTFMNKETNRISYLSW